MGKKVFKIKVADICIEISCLHDKTRAFCNDYVSNSIPDFSTEINSQDVFNEKKINNSDIHNAEDWYYEVFALCRKISSKLLDYGVILFHGSSVCVDGYSYIFTGKSGVGKSTHARYWIKNIPNSIIINDDKPFIKVNKNKSVVFGSPWNGKHRLSTNTSALLKSICLIEKSQKNAIERLDSHNIVEILLKQIFIPDENDSVKKILDIIELMASNINFYKMECMPNDEAALMAYKEMKND